MNKKKKPGGDNKSFFEEDIYQDQDVCSFIYFLFLILPIIRLLWSACGLWLGWYSFRIFRANSPPLPPRAPERGLVIRIKAPPARASADKPSASDTITDMNSLAAVSELRFQWYFSTFSAPQVCLAVALNSVLCLTSVPGIPGQDYPTLDFYNLPATSFECRGRVNGGWVLPRNLRCQNCQEQPTPPR